VGFEIVRFDEERERWDAALAKLPNRMQDVYFTSAYNLLCQRNGDGRAMGCIFTQAETLILYPFLLRDLSSLPYLGEEFSSYHDVSTAYGFGGPLVYKRGGDEDAVDTFRLAFDHWCKHENVVSEFVRFHPLLETHMSMNRYMECVSTNTTVWCQIDRSQGERLATLNAATRRNVRKALANGLTFKVERTAGAYERFAELYRQTMKRRGALPYYFFSDDYFRGFRELLGDAQALLSVSKGEEMIAGALFMRSPDFIHYHLGGSDPGFLELRPNNLLFFEAMQWGYTLGATALHLGGGYRPDDGLFRFKAGFSPLRARFWVGRAVHDEEAYTRARQARDAQAEGASAVPGTFFPAYRAPASMRSMSMAVRLAS
jgi:serine/alanine adding enzyme